MMPKCPVCDRLQGRETRRIKFNESKLADSQMFFLEDYSKLTDQNIIFFNKVSSQAHVIEAHNSSKTPPVTNSFTN